MPFWGDFYNSMSLTRSQSTGNLVKYQLPRISQAKRKKNWGLLLGCKMEIQIASIVELNDRSGALFS